MFVRFILTDAVSSYHHYQKIEDTKW